MREERYTVRSWVGLLVGDENECKIWRASQVSTFWVPKKVRYYGIGWMMEMR